MTCAFILYVLPAKIFERFLMNSSPIWLTGWVWQPERNVDFLLGCSIKLPADSIKAYHYSPPTDIQTTQRRIKRNVYPIWGSTTVAHLRWKFLEICQPPTLVGAAPFYCIRTRQIPLCKTFQWKHEKCVAPGRWMTERLAGRSWRKACRQAGVKENHEIV